MSPLDPIALLGWVGSALVVVSLTQRDLRRLRQVNLAASVALLVFNLSVEIASMVALNLVLLSVNAHHLLAERRHPPDLASRRPQET